MPSCCAINCSKRARLFRLPTGDKNADRREIWLKNIGRKFWRPEVAYICETHFTSDQFEQNRADGRKLLKWNAIPTLFPSRVTKIKSRFIKNAKIPEEQECVVKDPSKDQDDSDADQDTSNVFLEHNRVPNGNPEGVDDPIDCMKLESSTEDGKNLDWTEMEKVLNEDILYLKRKLRVVKNKTKNLEIIKSRFQKNLKLIFDGDQIQNLSGNPSKDITWSNQSIEKAKKLFMTCGRDGYKEILQQNLPFPPLELLLKFHPELESKDL